MNMLVLELLPKLGLLATEPNQLEVLGPIELPRRAVEGILRIGDEENRLPIFSDVVVEEGTDRRDPIFQPSDDRVVQVRQAQAQSDRLELSYVVSTRSCEVASMYFPSYGTPRGCTVLENYA